MKSLTLRSGIALACALSMAGCGGHSGNLQLGGQIIGLNRDGLILKNGNEELPVANGAVGFVFTQLLSSDQEFDVTVKTDPDAAHCTVANGKGRTGAFSISSVVVTCVTQSKDIGGIVSGLQPGESVILVNGANRQEVTANGPFTMTHPAAAGTTVSGQVDVGQHYGVTVLPPPAGRSTPCSVTNGSGTVDKDTAVDKILVSCN